MKKNSTHTLTLLLSLISFALYAQNLSVEPNGEGGEYFIAKNDAQHPCITPQEYAFVEKQCAENRKALGLSDAASRSTATTSLGWPLKAAAGFNDCSFYSITAYVDHDSTTGVKDWNCGTNTYDSHRGTDIAVFPFPFYKMDNNQVEVIAAAAGTILFKSDGNFDRNCAGNNLTANYIVIEHADGSQAHYWHMKMNSVTSKAVGQTVAAGEYLGVVGSSGSSTAPHLHFEVWNGTTVSTLIDPWSGTCNNYNANSWWATQKPYTEPAVIKASVNTTDVVVPACPTTETPNESTSFTIPFQGPGLSPGYAKFYAFLRNETSGMIDSLTILNPNGTIFNSWTYNSTANYNASYRGFSKLLPTTAGTYTFKAKYNGITCSQDFTINTLTSVDALKPLLSIQIYPNPAEDVLNISGSKIANGDYSFTLTNVIGETVLKQDISVENNAVRKTFSVAALPYGIYFLAIEKDGIRTVVKVNKMKG